MPLKSRDLAITAAEAALKKKATDVTILDVSGLTVIADHFVICSGESTTQVKAVAGFIAEELARKRVKPLGVEGAAYSHWILLDYGDVIVHIFEKETRAYYNLEKLWMDAKVIEIDEDKGDLAGEDKRAIYS
jgi:ribosome-associated protein